MCLLNCYIKIRLERFKLAVNNLVYGYDIYTYTSIKCIVFVEVLCTYVANTVHLSDIPLYGPWLLVN